MKKEFICKTLETMFDLEFDYYLKSDKKKSYIKKIGIDIDSDETIDLICHSNNILEDIKKTLEFEWEKNSFFYGYPTIESGGIITKKTAELIIKGLRDAYQEEKRKAEKYKTGFIDYLKEKGLDPIPSGGNQYSWYAKCPYSGGKHFIMVSTQDDTFGCGYCKKKGDQQAMKEYFNSHREVL